jgi:carbon storage regulator CsrA
MLVLQRKRLEQIIITIPGHEPITICVVDIQGDRVRIGIEADRGIPVDRAEIHQRKVRAA